MRLVDLNPSFYGTGGEGITDAQGRPVPERAGVGVTFDCLCRKCNVGAAIPFENPLDGGPPLEGGGWRRTGETFETLTLTPSIHRVRDKGGCGWHGFLKEGVFTSC